LGAADRVSAIVVRPARLSDSQAIGEVHVAAWRESYAGLISADRLRTLDVAKRVGQWRRQLASGTARGICVAALDERVVGFASCTRQREPNLLAAGYSGEVAAIYVLREAQGQDAGRRLMAAMARRLIAEGERSMALWVLEANAPARRFYERLDGRLIAERTDGTDREVAYGWRDLGLLRT
jgi:ribosomal protein S18 acetylase RimI-like enzyme